MALAWVSLRKLERRATVVTDDAWLELLGRCKARLNLHRPVILLKSVDRRIPMTWGVARSRVLLPENAEGWTETRRELTLLHELAHVKRRDSVVNYITLAACALYWFNPLSWQAARRLRSERERACDDLVLASGSDASDYAEELLGLATSLDSAPFASAIASPMAQRSALEGRLLAILDGGINRAALTWSKVAGSTALVAAILVPTSMLRGVAAKAQPASNVASVSADAASSSEASENVSRSFRVQPGGTLLMDLKGGDIEVMGTDGDQVSVTVERTVHHASGEKAAKLLEEHEIVFGQEGNNVTIRSGIQKTAGGSGSGARPSLSCRYRVTTPHNYNLELGSGGGSIRVGAIDGKVIAKSGGGNLLLDAFRGSQILAASGGGEIAVDMANSPKEHCLFSSGGGEIRLKAPEGLAVNLVATTGGGKVKCEFPVTMPQLSTDQIYGTINGGGPEMKADTGGAELKISKR